MKRLLVLALVLGLGGCTQLQTLYTSATTSVTPTQAITAANAFDAIESTATAWLVYCKGTPTGSTCTSTNRQSVIKAVRTGRSARNQIETALSSGASIASVVYNTLVAAVTTLQASPVTAMGAR